MPANNYLLDSQTDLLYDPARYTGVSPVVVDNDNDTIGLSTSFINTVNGKLDTSTFTDYSAEHATDDVTPYTGGTGISVTNHQISCTGDITPYTGGTGISVSNHQISCTGDITAYTGGTGISVSNHQISCTGDITPYTGSTGISVTNHQISCTGDITPYTGGTGISVTNHQISCTGDITAYTAGANITISNHVVAGKDWSYDISTAISTALTNYQTKLSDITDVQVVTSLPASPVANVLYLVKE